MWPLDTGDKELSFWLPVLPTYAILGKLFSFSNPAFPHPHNRGKKCAFLFVLFENEKKTCKQSFELLAAMEEALRSAVVISIMKPVHLLSCLLAVHGCQAVLLAVEFPSTQHQVLRFLQEGSIPDLTALRLSLVTSTCPGHRLNFTQRTLLLCGIPAKRHL